MRREEKTFPTLSRFLLKMLNVVTLIRDLRLPVNVEHDAGEDNGAAPDVLHCKRLREEKEGRDNGEGFSEGSDSDGEQCAVTLDH